MKRLPSTILLSLTFGVSSCINTPPTEEPSKPPIPSAEASFDFEDWTYSKTGYFWNRGDDPIATDAEEPYYETNSSFYETINKIFSLSGGGLPPGPLTTFRDIGFESNYSAKLKSDWFTLGDPPIFIPGACGTITIDIAALVEGGNLAIFGRPYTKSDDIITGYYKYQPVGKDYGAIWVDIWRYDKTTNRRDTLGSTRIKISNDPNNTHPAINGQVAWQKHYPITDQWTKFEAPIVYRPGKENLQPDSINVLFASSGDFNFSDLFSCKGETGSSLWIDQIVIGKTQK